MVTIQCTRDLLEYVKAEVGREATRPSNRLGDWYAKRLSTKRGKLAICVSERSLLPVLVAATTDAGAFVLGLSGGGPLGPAGNRN